MNDIIKKYIIKNYKLYKIHPLYPVSKSKKNTRTTFMFFDYEKHREVEPYYVRQTLCKIFSVDLETVDKVIIVLVDEEIKRLKEQQTILGYE